MGCFAFCDFFCLVLLRLLGLSTVVHASAEGPHLITITLNCVYTKSSHLREEEVERPSEWNAGLMTLMVPPWLS
jgi:hypothetical protein